MYANIVATHTTPKIRIIEMNINTFVDSQYNPLEVGQTVKFKTHYGYQNSYTLEGTGIIESLSIYCQIQIKMQGSYTSVGRYSQCQTTNRVTLHGDYDFNTKKVVFGKSRSIMQFDFPTVLDEYLYIQKKT